MLAENGVWIGRGRYADFNTPSHMTMPGYENVRIDAEHAFDEDFSRNGRIVSFAIVEGEGQ